jgi:hypothetical protein
MARSAAQAATAAAAEPGVEAPEAAFVGIREFANRANRSARERSSVKGGLRKMS